MNSKDYYINQYKEYHKNPGVYPGDMRYDTKFIKAMIEDYNPTTLLDFGCGKGYQYSCEKLHEKYFNGIMPHLYDPGVPEFSKFPEGKFDGVFSCDVMEHVPEDAVPEVLEQIYSKANKFVFIAASNVPAIAVLPNGENAHVTLKPYHWWVEQICKVATVDTLFVIRGMDRYLCSIKNNRLVELVQF